MLNVITGALVLGLVLVLALILLSGRGAFLIAGYNTSSKEEKSRWNKKRLCRGVGAYLLFTFIWLAVMLALGIQGVKDGVTPLGVVFVLLTIGFVVFVNFSHFFKNQ